MVPALLLLTAVLLAGSPAVGAGPAPQPETVAKNLAQNVLGEGTVRSVRVSADRGEVDIAWDAVLYRPSQTPAVNREQLRGEAELATGSILGVMKPRVIRFTILVGVEPIARGTRTWEAFTITYAQGLGK
ncbi:MAG TPA: hypothetical protein VFW08_04040 [bacterium]|nr:hypothetical protein [bacterium]